MQENLPTSPAQTLQIHGWERWQSYRADRGQPPWIKIHRCVMRCPEWVELSDAERGQMVAMWLLAADRNGVIPASPVVIKKLCFLDSEPDIQLFINQGFIEPDVIATPAGRHRDSPEKRRVEKRREDTCTESDDSTQVIATLPLVGKNSEGGAQIRASQVGKWESQFPGVSVHVELNRMHAWLEANKPKRKTRTGINRFIVAWLSRAQDKGGSKLNGQTYDEPETWR